VQRVSPGQVVPLDVSSSHYSSRKFENVSLQWQMVGIDNRGRFFQDLAKGRVPIAFQHRQVAPAHAIELPMPQDTMLCTALVSAEAPDGKRLAENFVHYFVSNGYPSEREETARALILRGFPANWHSAEWSGGYGDKDKAAAEDCAFGMGHGFFEWVLPLKGAELSKAHRVRILCEASSHRTDNPQTDGNIFPTTLLMSLNEIPVYRATLRNHPHDARGVLSYLRGVPGAYGYPAQATAEGELLNQVASSVKDGTLRFRCAVPADTLAQGGLTIYGAECGRFPICPTVIIDW